MDTLADLFEGLTAANTISFAGTDAFRGSDGPKENVNGANMSALVNAIEISWGDVALLLSVPFQGLGNAAISGVATDEQLERLGKVWAAMAITEPSFGSDSAAVSTTAKLDGDEYVINGEKIYVTAGSRATHIVVWATLDKAQGRAAIKSFIVPPRTSRSVRRAPRAQARHQGIRHRGHPLRQRAHPEGQPAVAAQRSRWTRVLPG